MLGTAYALFSNLRTPKLAPTDENPGDLGVFWRQTAMKVETFNPFGHPLHVCVDRLPRFWRRPPTRLRSGGIGRMLAAIAALGLPLMQTVPAFAGEQVLEIPQVVATAPATAQPHPRVPDLYDTTVPISNADAYASAGRETSPVPAAMAPDPAPPPAKVADNSESYPPDPNVGSINDYQNQPGENGSRPSYAFAGGARRSEPQGSMSTNLIIGGILVGMIAIEIASAHHHRR